MHLDSSKTIISGIEPIDELMGGLDRGQIYLVHGEADGKSLFGIKFLIEGLKHGENVALVVRSSPEDAVRRFARLGYDCLEDVYSGRLVILECSEEMINRIGKLRELTPVLRELEWLLGETRPRRLIFDPVTSVLAGAEGDLGVHTREFADWARSFGATVVLISNGSNPEIVENFEPLVAQSFRFDLREVGDRAARFIAFEKSSGIPDQAIEVDPCRGVILSRQPATSNAPPPPPSLAELESIREELRSVRDRIHQQEEEALADIDLLTDEPAEEPVPQITPEPEPIQVPDTTELVSKKERAPQVLKSAQETAAASPQLPSYSDVIEELQ